MISIVIPAYNEEAAIGDEIRVIHEAFTKAGKPFEIIVVDDGSKDRTAEIVEKSPARLIRHKKNRGVGAARKTGTRAAKYDWVAMTDADGTYPNALLPELTDRLEHCEMVVGARTGKNVAKSWARMPAKWVIRMLASYMAQAKIPDLNSGLRAFRKETALKYFYLLPNTHSWVATITLAFLCNEHEVEFVPVDYFHRKGSSTFHPLYDTYNYVSLVIRTIMYFKPLRVFMPMSFAIGAVGLAKTTHDFFVFHLIGGFDVFIMVTAVLILCIGLLADLIVVTHRRR